jgi:hypothetical protein
MMATMAIPIPMAAMMAKPTMSMPMAARLAMVETYQRSNWPQDCPKELENESGWRNTVGVGVVGHGMDPYTLLYPAFPFVFPDLIQ